MPRAAIDACCLIDLLATGHVEAILLASQLDWYLPVAVEGEVQHIRQYDPANPGQIVKVPMDLSPLKNSGILQPCAPTGKTEQDCFVRYAAQFRSDGEAMCIAIAAQRGLIVATDDRKAIRVAQQAGLSVVSCPELMKKWSSTTDHPTLHKALCDIETLAQFSPNSAMPEHNWWVEELAKSKP